MSTVTFRWNDSVPTDHGDSYRSHEADTRSSQGSGSMVLPDGIIRPIAVRPPSSRAFLFEALVPADEWALLLGADQEAPRPSIADVERAWSPIIGATAFLPSLSAALDDLSRLSCFESVVAAFVHVSSEYPLRDQISAYTAVSKAYVLAYGILGQSLFCHSRLQHVLARQMVDLSVFDENGYS